MTTTHSIDHHLRLLRGRCPAPQDHQRCLHHSEVFIESGQLRRVVLALLGAVAQDVLRTQSTHRLIENLGYGPEVRQILIDLVAIDQGIDGLEWDDTSAAYLDYVDSYGYGYERRIADLRSLALLLPTRGRG